MLDFGKIRRPDNLPQWERPPVDEVAISIQFNDIPGLKIVHYGQFGERLSKVGLVQHEDKGPINPTFEVFGKRVAPVQFQFQAVDIPLPRVWYLSNDKHRLVQVQPDRFVYNWRKVEGEGVYPGLNDVLPEFVIRCQSFQDFLTEQGLPQLSINQCELSYFNILGVEEHETYHHAFARIFSFWSDEANTNPLNDGSSLEQDAGNIALTHILRGNDGSPLARIHTHVQAAERSNKRVIRLSLVFRGPWTQPVGTPLLEFFALGREAIVRLFDSMITEQMHREWGRTIASQGK